MKNLMLGLLFGTLMLTTSAFATATSTGSSAPGHISQNACTLAGGQNNTISGCGTGEKAVDSKTGLASEIVNTILYIGGIVSLIFVVIGGIQYITSTGDPGRIQKAKDTVLYAVIGLIVTFLAIPAASYVIKAIGA